MGKAARSRHLKLVRTLEREAGVRGRLLELYGVDAGTATEGQFVALARSGLGDHLVDAVVITMRDRGSTWLRIAGALDVSRQAAAKRYAAALRRALRD